MVSTPIGNLEDITQRAVRILREVDRIACEDTRVTGKLLSALEIETPLIRHERHNEAASTQGILQLLEDGESIALVSDAGTPGVSDPGERLVRETITSGFKVTPVPGPSAMLAALVASGLPTASFAFHGFFPPRASQRREALTTLTPGTHVFFCPSRSLQRTLSDLDEVRGACAVAIGREITKLHESWYRGTPAEIREKLSSDDLKGEAVVVIHVPAAAGAVTDEEIVSALLPHLAEGTRPSEAARTVAQNLGIGRRRVYQLALDL